MRCTLSTAYDSTHTCRSQALHNTRCVILRYHHRRYSPLLTRFFFYFINVLIKHATAFRRVHRFLHPYHDAIGTYIYQHASNDMILPLYCTYTTMHIIGITQCIATQGQGVDIGRRCHCRHAVFLFYKVRGAIRNTKYVIVL